MSRSHANPLRTQDQQDNVDSRQPRDALEAFHAASNEMETLRLVNQRLLRELAELARHRQHPQEAQQAREAITPLHGMNNNTSAPPETLAEEEKIVRLRSMTLADLLVTATTGRRRAGTTKATIQSPANLKGSTILGTTFQRLTTRARPYKGSRKGPDPSINGRFGIADGIPVHGQSSALPFPNKV